MESGILYVVFNKWISDPESDEMPYKIGITRNSVEDRYYGLGLKMPGKFETLFAYTIKDYAKAEQSIQNILNKKCVNGEWFKLNQKDIDFIKEICERMDGILITEEIENEINDETEHRGDNDFFNFSNTETNDGKASNELMQKVNKNNSINMLSKSEAISVLNKKLSLNLKNSNTIYSNINASKPEWWFEPENSRFNNDFNLLLNNHNNRILYHFFIKSGTIKEPEKLFYQRNDKHKQNKSTIYIRVTDSNFADKAHGFQFKEYLINEIKY
jgi:hypothetical protein